jgi:hypothetical protein
MIFRSFIQSESHVTTAERSFSPQQCRGPPGADNQIILRIFCVQNGTTTVFWGAHFDETAGLPVVIIHHLCRLYLCTKKKHTNKQTNTHTHMCVYIYIYIYIYI